MRKILTFGAIILIIYIMNVSTLYGLYITTESNKIKTEYPICSVRWFIFCDFSSSGNVSYAKNKSFIGLNSIEMMYYNVSYGSAFVRGPFFNMDFEGVLSIYTYGFKGNISWNETVDNAYVWAEGSAFLVRVAYHY